MAIDQNAQKSFFDALYCDEEKWPESEECEEECVITVNKNDFNATNHCLFPSLEQDLIWDDDELKSLFLKEKETCFVNDISKTRFSPSLGRKEAVEWILKINTHYGFSTSTAILAANYIDRFLLTLRFQNDKQQPWMMQLAAVACLSVAAKVEETHVPLLLDLQVVGTECVFEAKTVQRMELLVLSSLKWRMNPVTPLSFIDHIIRRLELQCYIHREFLHSCEDLLLSLLSDSRFLHYLPSVLATATVLHVIHQADSCNGIDYEDQLVSILKISKEEVDSCYELISCILPNHTDSYGKNNPLKRKFCQIPSSSSGVTDVAIFTCDSSNDSWSMDSSCISSSSCRKSRVHEQKMKLPSLSRGFVDAVGSPHH